jgi:hypothetical protein
VEQAVKGIIIEAVEEDFLLKIKDETLGFLNQTPRSMINHLRKEHWTLQTPMP